MKFKGKTMLKISGILSIVLGLVIAFVGLYVMVLGLTHSISNGEENTRILKYISDGGIYILCFGGFMAFAGIVGLTNGDSRDHIKKIFRYSLIIIGLCVLNIIVYCILAAKITLFSMGILLLILVVSILYFVGAFMNWKAEKEFSNQTN
jgi:peptidoglycan/LPS O-acetylase OafA/YrhL